MNFFKSFRNDTKYNILIVATSLMFPFSPSQHFVRNVYPLIPLINNSNSKDTIEGRVIEEEFSNGLDSGTGCIQRNPTRYKMVVECADNHTREYWYYHSEARRLDELFNVGSTGIFPIQGRNVKIIG
ncbi:hypothetical protein J4471_02660 [Candidatus Woesearchaeota archaeon]|nr:hypothetical protein [Candidatus Woesearchaeota archaeon]